MTSMTFQEALRRETDKLMRAWNDACEALLVAAVAKGASVKTHKLVSRSLAFSNGANVWEAWVAGPGDVDGLPRYPLVSAAFRDGGWGIGIVNGPSPDGDRDADG